MSDIKEPSPSFVFDHNQEFDIRYEATPAESVLESVLESTVSVDTLVSQALSTGIITISEAIDLTSLVSEEEIKAQLAGLISKRVVNPFISASPYIGVIHTSEATIKIEPKPEPMVESMVESVVEPKSEGLRYNDGKLDFTLMDLKAFEPMIQVLEYGAHKYSKFRHPISNEVYKGSECSVEDVKRNKMLTISSGRDNWKLGGPNMSLLKLTSSLFRHLAAFLGGEDNDKESHLPHTGHMMCNIMFLSYHLMNHQKNKKQKKGSQFDDRFKS